MIKFEICKGFENKGIELPIRSTRSSAGYDFFAAEDVIIPSIPMALKRLGIGLMGAIDWTTLGLKPTLIPTGIKACYPDNVALLLINRSGNPIKFGLQLTNGLGLVDSDYYSNPDNDGHIMFQFINWSTNDLRIAKGTKIGQGVFIHYLNADNIDESDKVREGGHGSTGDK